MAAPATRCPIPIDDFAASTADVSEAVGLPPECYVDPRFHDFEMEAVFGHSWLCVGRVEQVAKAGDYLATTVAGREPIIVVRNREGEITAFSSVCRHRGMVVVAPAERPREEVLEQPPLTMCGSTRSFRCPYHWWVYDLDGVLVNAPEMEHRADFARGSVRLPTLRVEVWMGFIFVNLDPDAAPLTPTLQKLSELVRNHDLGEMTTVDPEVLADVPFNWKIMCENFMEAYHSSRLHNTLYAFDRTEATDESLLSGTVTEYEPGDGAIAGWGRTAYKNRGLNPTQHALFPPIPTLTDDEQWRMIYAFVPPTLLLGVCTDSVFWFTVSPRSVSSHVLSMGYMFPPGTADLKLFRQLLAEYKRGVELFNNQDLPANIAVQQGMASRYAPRGPLSRQDVFLVQFNQWLVERYRAADATSSHVAPAGAASSNGAS